VAKHKFLFGFLILSFLLRLFSLPLSAQSTQPAGLCYSQCGFYKFYWKGDFCYDLVQQNCTESFSLKDVVSMVKTIRSSFLTGKLKEVVDVTPIFKAWLICKPLIEDCIVPQLDACKTTCEQSPTFYAPNLSVGSDWGSFHGLYYDDEKKLLYLRVVNNGFGYASDIGVQLTYGYTANQDGSGMTGGTYLSETIPELLFLGSRQAAPKGVGDIVTDFLIDESNFSSFLQRFKSDADNYYIPPAWEKTIQISAPEGKLTRFILNVDYNQEITESSENDNTYILEIDKRPTPARFEFEKIEVIRIGDTLTDYQIKATVKNSGDLDGNALVSFYEGNQASGNPVYNQSERISGHDRTVFTAQLQVDVTEGSPSCARNKRFLATVKDENGAVRQAQFEIPLYAGYVAGRVTDSKGKPVKGAIVKASTGQSATTGESGFYHLSGIGVLGEVTLSFSHPDYTAITTKKTTISFEKDNTLLGACQIKGLGQYNVDAILKDQPLKLTVRLKSAGNLINGRVLFTGGNGVFSYEIEGEKIIEEMEPGQFRVTAGAPGYITKEVRVVITPPEYTLEIELELLGGRENDDGLSLITPVKLWEKTIEKGITSVVAGAKNGKLLVVNINDSSNKSGGIESWAGKLSFINPLDGTIIKSATVPFNVGQSHVDLDASYDGRTVGFTYSIIPPEEKTRFETFVKVFNASGNEFGTTSLGKSRAVMSEVSPDGYYFYPHQLMNSNLYKYTRKEIEGIGDGRDFQSYLTSEDLHFLRNNNFVAGCKGQGGQQCIVSISDQTVKTLGEVDGGSRVIDSSTDGQTIAIRNYKKVYYFSGNSWNRELESDPGFESVAVTPGGEYVIVAKGSSGSNSLVIFDKNGKEVTPKFDYKNVRYVEANDRGIFFASVVLNKISYYQIGKYGNDYNPPEVSKTPGQTSFGGIQVYVDTQKNFQDINYILTWERMYANVLYKTKDKITIATSWGKLILSAGTVFVKSESGEPMLLWGQAEVETATPITMVVFKNKLADPEKLRVTYDQYYQGTLSADKYVIIRNLHTRYSVKAQKGIVAINVSKGTVETSFNNQKINIDQGAKITVDEKNRVTSGRIFPTNLYLILGGILLVIVIFLERKYKDTAFVKKSKEILGKLIILIWKLLKKALKLLFKTLRSIIVGTIKLIKGRLKRK